MKFQVGDKVLVLHSEEEGEIIEFINKKMALVDVRGVRFPVYLDQLDFPYYKRFTRQKQQKTPSKRHIDDIPKEKTDHKERQEDGVMLQFIPVMDVDEFGDEYVEKLKIYLVNHTKTAYIFDYRLSFFGETEFEIKNTIQPFENFYVHDVPFEDMNDSPSFELRFSLLETVKTKAEEYEAIVKMKPKQIFSRIETLRQKNESSFSQLLFDKYPDRATPTKLPLDSLITRGYKVYNAKEARQHLEAPQSVVDLHIEKLTDAPARMNNFEKLTLQLKTFEKYYDLAVTHMLPHLIIIHGVGTGKLRDEIHDLLRLKKEVSYFINQYHPRYGYGATEIFFKH
ncbi:hypothetical protein GCM10027051_24850 [Niabella terrae]